MNTLRNFVHDYPRRSNPLNKSSSYDYISPISVQKEIQVKMRFFESQFSLLTTHNFPLFPNFFPRRGTLLLLFELVTEDHFRCGVESIASFLCVGFDCRLESDSSLPDRGKLGVMHTSHVMVGDPRDLFFFRREEEEEEEEA